MIMPYSVLKEEKALSGALPVRVQELEGNC